MEHILRRWFNIVKIKLIDLVEDYLYNKTIVENSDLEISMLSYEKDIEELTNRKINLQSKIILAEKYDYSYVFTEKEVNMIKTLYMEKPIEDIYSKFNIKKIDFENWMNILKQKLKKINIYIEK